MTTPTDHEIETELHAMLRAEAETITPEPALHKILTRAHQAGRPRRARRRRGWLPVIGGAIATGGLVAAAIVIFAPDADRATEPSVSCAVQIQAGCDVDLAVWYVRLYDDQLLSHDVAVTSTGDAGLDAVRALLRGASAEGYANYWHGFATNDPGPIAEVNSVSHANGVVTVDFDRPLTSDLAALEGDGTDFGERIIQQLVLTVQSALRTEDPVLLTVDGDPADEAFGVTLNGPVPSDWSQVAGIRVDRPDQSATLGSPVTISGTSSTNEGNVLWQVTEDGELVDEGHTTGGGSFDYLPFSVQVKLKPGTYTVKLWEPSLASAPEGWSDELSVVYVDFTVE